MIVLMGEVSVPRSGADSYVEGERFQEGLEIGLRGIAGRYGRWKKVRIRSGLEEKGSWGGVLFG